MLGTQWIRAQVWARDCSPGAPEAHLEPPGEEGTETCKSISLSFSFCLFYRSRQILATQIFAVKRANSTNIGKSPSPIFQMSSPPRRFSFFGVPPLLSSLTPVLFQSLGGRSAPFTETVEGGGRGGFSSSVYSFPPSPRRSPPLPPPLPFSVSVPLNFPQGKTWCSGYHFCYLCTLDKCTERIWTFVTV